MPHARTRTTKKVGRKRGLSTLPRARRDAVVRCPVCARPYTGAAVSLTYREVDTDWHLSRCPIPQMACTVNGEPVPVKVMTSGMSCMTPHCPGRLKLMFVMPPAACLDIGDGRDIYEWDMTRLERASEYADPRDVRAREIREEEARGGRPAFVQTSDPGVVLARSQTTPGMYYTLTWSRAAGEWYCDCPDFAQSFQVCKHVRALPGGLRAPKKKKKMEEEGAIAA